MANGQFGTRLRSLRDRAGLSLKQLAEKIGTNEFHIVGWERNVDHPEMAMALLLAAALKVSTDELLNGGPLNPRKRTVRLTADNFAVHLKTDYAASLVTGYTVPADGIDPDDLTVSKLLAWIDLQSDRPPDVTYEMSPLIAAIFLERLATR